ncbi:DUF1833 domain-containing protein [Tardiphaga sp. 37S4]|uniref:DUF1833 family protein n=1 Tax=Tardiphaga sp. 37S4 TaxID=1404741 RepID=UPI001E28907A|nr:DUF1833 family protein [Tardiphaga sp. 37S4]UFS77226.1 DUF1833 domain-containing protein [Tardiphaga sp. 37S4]
MRVLSLNMREALFGQESGEVPIFLLTITHPDLDEPIRLTTDPTERKSDTPLIYRTMSRGEEFIFAGIDVTIPDEQDKSPPASKLTIENVTRDMIPLARSVNSPPSVKIEAVLASALDDVEMNWPALDMSNLNYDAAALQFDLTMDALVTEPYPAGSFSPAYFSGLYY